MAYFEAYPPTVSAQGVRSLNLLALSRASSRPQGASLFVKHLILYSCADSPAPVLQALFCIVQGRDFTQGHPHIDDTSDHTNPFKPTIFTSNPLTAPVPSSTITGFPFALLLLSRLPTNTSQVLLEQLPTVGDVTVNRGAAPLGFSDGYTWTVTFETQIENLELLVVDGNSTGIPIVGPNAQVSATEIQRGVAPFLALDLAGLEPGETYVARVSAENAAGFGPTTTADAADGGDRGSNNDGLGVVPFGMVARAAPQAPRIGGVVAVSASQLEVSLEEPTDSPGFDTLGYKVRRVDWR